MKKNKQKLKSVFKWTFACFFTLFVVLMLILNLVFPLKYKQIVQKYSNENDINPALVYSVIWTESKFDSKAVSKAGAVGLMQLMPSTAKWCCLALNEEYSYQKLFDEAFNIKLGTYYLNYLIQKYGEKKAIIAYNAGEGNMLSWQGKIKFDETKNYTKRIKITKKIYSLKTRR